MKRNHDDVDVDDILTSMPTDKGLLPGFLQLSKDELATVLGHLANRGDLPTSAIKRARIDLPSFSTEKWSEFALQHGLPEKAKKLTLDPLTTPKYRLPPSLLETMLENSWHWQDVYCETLFQEKEAGKVRLLEPYLVPMMALFQGRIYDSPEDGMGGTKYSTGGHIEHEFFMIGGILFLVIELDKLGASNLAQLFLELLSAAEMNKERKFAGLRVYGLLTDLEQFRFYSYDPSTEKFYFDEWMVAGNMRLAACSDMIEVVSKIFGLVLTGYIDGLRAIVKWSEDGAKKNDFSQRISAPAIEDSSSPKQLNSQKTEDGGCKSSTQWEVALQFANRCVEKFQEPATSFEEVENRANSALEWLTKSVRSIPRASHFTGRTDDPSTPIELKALAAKIVKEENVLYLSQIKCRYL